MNIPISGEWLKRNGFKLCGRMPGGELNRSKRLSNELLLEVSPPMSEDRSWFCWLVQDDPRRSIHIRHVDYIHELVLIAEAITGEPFVASGDLEDLIADVAEINDASGR